MLGCEKGTLALGFEFYIQMKLLLFISYRYVGVAAISSRKWYKKKLSTKCIHNHQREHADIVVDKSRTPEISNGD